MKAFCSLLKLEDGFLMHWLNHVNFTCYLNSGFTIPFTFLSYEMLGRY